MFYSVVIFFIQTKKFRTLVLINTSIAFLYLFRFDQFKDIYFTVLFIIMDISLILNLVVFLFVL